MIELSLEGLSLDYAIQNSKGEITHIFEVKHSFSPHTLDQLKRYEVYSVLRGQKETVKMILACLDGNEWRFWDVDANELFIKDLFEKDHRETSCSIFYWVAGILAAVCLVELLSPLFFPCHGVRHISPLSHELVVLLCVAGVFAVFPSLLPRVKGIQFGRVVPLIITFNDTSIPPQ